MAPNVKDPYKVQHLTRKQLEALFAAVEGNLPHAALLRTIYTFGLRVQELCQLSREDYHGDFLVVRRVKGGVSRALPVPDKLRRLYLGPYLESRDDEATPLFITRLKEGWSYRGVHWLFRKYATAAGIPEEFRHPHVLRHSIAVHSLEQGIKMPVIQNLLGHKSITTTSAMYARYSAEALREELKDFDYL